MNPIGHESSEAAGTRWLGEVPSHWQVTRLKNVADYWVSNVDKVPADGEEPVRLCNYTDVYYNEHLHPNLSLMQTTATAAEIRQVPPAGRRCGDHKGLGGMERHRRARAGE